MVLSRNFPFGHSPLVFQPRIATWKIAGAKHFLSSARRFVFHSISVFRYRDSRPGLPRWNFGWNNTSRFSVFQSKAGQRSQIPAVLRNFAPPAAVLFFPNDAARLANATVARGRVFRQIRNPPTRINVPSATRPMPTPTVSIQDGSSARNGQLLRPCEQSLPQET